MPEGFLGRLGRALNPLGSGGGASGTATRIGVGGALGGPIGAGAVALGIGLQRLRNRGRVPEIPSGNAPGVPWGQLRQRPYVLPRHPVVPVGGVGAGVSAPVNPPPGWNPDWGVPPPPPRGPENPLTVNSFGNMYPGSTGAPLRIARSTDGTDMGDLVSSTGSFLPTYTDLSERDPYNRIAYKFSSALKKSPLY